MVAESYVSHSLRSQIKLTRRRSERGRGKYDLYSPFGGLLDVGRPGHHHLCLGMVRRGNPEVESQHGLRHSLRRTREHSNKPNNSERNPLHDIFSWGGPTSFPKFK